MSSEIVLRPELVAALWEQADYIEKRRLFLQSYHFSRKRSGAERARRSMVRVRRLIWVRLRSVRRLPRLLWTRIRSSWFGRGRRFHPLVVQSHRSSDSGDWSSW